MTIRRSLLLEDPDYCAPICSMPPLLRSNNVMTNPSSWDPLAIPNKCFASRAEYWPRSDRLGVMESWSSVAELPCFASTSALPRRWSTGAKEKVKKNEGEKKNIERELEVWPIQHLAANHCLWTLNRVFAPAIDDGE